MNMKLIVACAQGHLATVQACLDDGDSPNAPSQVEGLSILHLAAHHGQSQVCGLLASRGADVNALDAKGKTPLQLALAQGQPVHVAAAVSLFRHGARFDPQGAEAAVLLRTAVRWDRVADVQRLLDLGVSPSLRPDDEEPPGHLAVRRKRTDIVGMLCDAGLPIDYRSDQGWTMLHVAAEEADLAGARWLLERGAEVDAVNAVGQTPLLVCALSQADHRTSMFVELVLRGADTQVRDTAGMTALQLARRGGMNSAFAAGLALTDDFDARREELLAVGQGPQVPRTATEAVLYGMNGEVTLRFMDRLRGDAGAMAHALAETQRVLDEARERPLFRTPKVFGRLEAQAHIVRSVIAQEHARQAVHDLGRGPLPGISI